MEKKDRDFRTGYNREAQEINRRNIGQAKDLDRYDNILRSIRSRNPMTRTVSYRKGGILRYDVLDLVAAQEYIDSLKAKRYKDGGKLENVPMYKNTPSTEIVT